MEPRLKLKSFVERTIVSPVVNLLRQGVTPEKISLSIALGVALGVTPVLGSTTLLCFLAALLLRLNLPAIQLVNYFVYPLQFVLLIPFFQMGEWIFSAEPGNLTLAATLHLVRTDAWGAVTTLWAATMHALVAWAAVGSLSALIIYVLLTPLLRRAVRSLRPEAM
jgi:uncharacterized protein (DUF2062 family)